VRRAYPRLNDWDSPDLKMQTGRENEPDITGRMKSMLRKIAVALIAATMFTAPVLAQGTLAPVAPRATIAAPAAKAGPVHVVRHVKKAKAHKRHASRHAVTNAKVANHATLARHIKKGKRVHTAGHASVRANAKAPVRTN
jgi:hypothetical protein